MGLIGGTTGESVTAELAALAVPAAFTWVRGETRRTFTVVDGRTGEAALFSEPGPRITPDGYAEFRIRYASTLAGCAAVVLSGSLPPGLPPGSYAELITMAVRRRGAGAAGRARGGAAPGRRGRPRHRQAEPGRTGDVRRPVPGWFARPAGSPGRRRGPGGRDGGRPGTPGGRPGRGRGLARRRRAARRHRRRLLAGGPPGRGGRERDRGRGRGGSGPGPRAGPGIPVGGAAAARGRARHRGGPGPGGRGVQPGGLRHGAGRGHGDRARSPVQAGAAHREAC